MFLHSQVVSKIFDFGTLGAKHNWSNKVLTRCVSNSNRTSCVQNYLKREKNIYIDLLMDWKTRQVILIN